MPHVFDREQFLDRHLGLSSDDRAEMLRVIERDSIDDLLSATIPEQIRLRASLALGSAVPEAEVLSMLRDKFNNDVVRRNYIGQGYYGTITPPVIKRNVLENPAWYTAYTPYQPEISQGRLEAILNFQTMIAELTGLALANASLLDEATAVAEAVTMARRVSKNPSNIVLVEKDIHPQTLNVLRTRTEPVGIEIILGGLDDFTDVDAFALVVSWPASSGALASPQSVAASVAHHRSRGVITIASTDLLACAQIIPPGQLGFDVAVGSAQRFGVPMGFGGPHAAFMAVATEHARSLPGRLVGVSTDTAGRPALRLSLQTREQHIRREKATSNICTAQVLLANIAGFYGAWHGPTGLQTIARRVHALASAFASLAVSKNLSLVSTDFFDTVALQTPDAQGLVSLARQHGCNIRQIDERTVSASFDETMTAQDVVTLLHAIGINATLQDVNNSARADQNASLVRTDQFMSQSVFGRYHTEHEMLRYVRRLSDKDLALDRTMIPLGSCTMKLNSTTEMEPITWSLLADLHPYVPADESVGYRSLITDLETMLCAITGYDAVSLQPNAGSQGEFAGLLAIRAYHRSRGDINRTICLIPSSAHGTNAASAVMAGMGVVVIACDESGNVDVQDLREKADAAGERLAALMVTYPSTHGVFETAISEICEIIHQRGGQVYVDGANLNALVAVAQPGKFGADVSHLNLHKTFCIPHGGGGPGVGPVAVRSHLAPFLPGHPLAHHDDSTVGAVSAAPFGSAGILAIPWVYISMMGPDGLLAATGDAILSANYVARRLRDVYPTLYSGPSGTVAHECILDIRGITKDTGVSVDDIAKRLMDFCFHAPTMSFPVTGTLMVEPTESESLAEVNRFIEAMLQIGVEIDSVRQGKVAIDDSPLRHAPHTVEDVVSSSWARPYSRETALFPTPLLRTRSFYPAVSRIDAVFGDRNLVCNCAPIEEYAMSLESITLS